MRLQSKKILGLFLLSLAYWIYLSLTTRMEIVFDSVGYESLGRTIAHQGWIPYFTGGPNREPVYPFLISIAMSLSGILGIAYTKIMAFWGVILLLLTQWLTWRILRLLNIREEISIGVLAYLAFSPALNNAAFSLYSEIAAVPVILGIILSSIHCWQAIKEHRAAKAVLNACMLGLLLTIATLIKAVFECMTPFYLIIFFFVAYHCAKARPGTLMLCVIAASSFYYLPIMGYKHLNQEYNGNFVITNRGSWALYGNTVRRMEPLTLKRFTEALAYAPGEGVCNNIFGLQECDFWSYRKSDEFGFARESQLQQQQLSPEKVNSTLIADSTHQALRNPLQYALLTFVEGLKMFFWESTQIGFVEYPHWLQKIYNIKLFNNALRFLLSVLSFIAMISLWKQSNKSPASFAIGLLIFLYIFFFSFFFILTRYALPVAPLYLIAIGFWLEQKLALKK